MISVAVVTKLLLDDIVQEKFPNSPSVIVVVVIVVVIIVVVVIVVVVVVIVVVHNVDGDNFKRITKQNEVPDMLDGWIYFLLPSNTNSVCI